MNIIEYLRGSINPKNIFDIMKYKYIFYKSHPNYFSPEGLIVFCGSQGSGKTLSAVQYIKKVCNDYPKAILVTNTDIKGIKNKTIGYSGLSSLKDIENGEYGVIYFIDEIHLEMNSLESKSIPIEVMVEISQQRKQRKHIVGTSQVFQRMAKPLREQIKNVVICKNLLGCIQFNKLVDGSSSYEENGKLHFADVKRVLWFHSPSLYRCYDTYKKMKRYKKEWNSFSSQNIYERSFENNGISNNT